ncbi:MAG TPA: glycosyltransferase family 2 protein [Phycisphaerae bacterium]|nr:glycosyltransferase family 2 protein [Phycisphaerae bacterium]HOJ75670.1 glycosyltransferase family 2 protein [Phycisphaerae bacterium]HON66414.1 glycosyltransferase family 2 protein [Phycisphaerae bacterium]HPP27812.1 glycosyltransferase family 2 protein [Phycisphaerae bacterium]HPU27187.1 glycosyltransferase family 2 protein [Phycisphaerae bacterium]
MLLSIVTPCYNESGNIAELHRQLSAVADRLDMDVEFVFVDDGSRDNTLVLLKEVAQRDPRARVVSLSRNFGHQAALTAGIQHAAGDAVVVMDADLQHPPELILDFVARWREGYDLVYAYREGVKPRLGYRLINALMKITVPAESADFRLMDRKMVDAFCRMPERARFIRGMIAWLGFKQIGVGYTDRQRFAGQRSYTLRQTARMALYAVLAFSSIPLRAAAVLGLATLGLGLLYAAYILYAWFAGHTIQGWTAQTMTILILGGVQLVCLGVIAEYIGRIFEEVKHRPLYVVREWIGPPRTPAGTAHATRDRQPVAAGDVSGEW